MASEAPTPAQIHDLVSRVRSGADGATHVVVFYGRWRETLDAFDRDGHRVGAAVRRERPNKQAGYRYLYEIGYQGPDTRAQCVLRDVTGRQSGFHPSLPMFSVLGGDGAALASIAGTGESVPTIWGLPAPDGFEIESAGVVEGRFEPAARTDPKRNSSQAWYLRDPAGRDLARVTCVQRERPMNAYVVEIDSDIKEPLRTIAPAFCVIADNLLADRSRSSVWRR